MFSSVTEQTWHDIRQSESLGGQEVDRKESVEFGIPEVSVYLEWQSRSLQHNRADNESLGTSGRYERTEKSLGGEEKVEKRRSR